MKPKELFQAHSIRLAWTVGGLSLGFGSGLYTEPGYEQAYSGHTPTVKGTAFSLIGFNGNQSQLLPGVGPLTT